jgi:hypothetical protein
MYNGRSLRQKTRPYTSRTTSSRLLHTGAAAMNLIQARPVSLMTEAPDAALNAPITKDSDQT